MDIKLSLVSLFFILTFTSQILPTFPLIITDDFDLQCYFMYLKSSSVTIVAFERIAKPLRDSGDHRKVMTALLERNLHSITPKCLDFVFFVDRENRLTLFDTDRENNKTVTMFVPVDEAIRFEEGISLSNQIVMSKVDEEDFKNGLLSKGSELEVWNRYRKSKLVVTHVSDDKRMVSIQGVNVTQWNIYNDGHVIVHGTDDFFQLGGGMKKHRRINTNEFEVD